MGNAKAKAKYEHEFVLKGAGKAEQKVQEMQNDKMSAADRQMQALCGRHPPPNGDKSASCEAWRNGWQ